MKGEDQGSSIAFYLAEALYRLGFPCDKVGDEGLKIVERFTSEEVEVETDKGILKGMRDYFEKIKSDPPDIPPMTFDSHLSPSEYVVLDDLIRSLEDLAGHVATDIGFLVFGTSGRCRFFDVSYISRVT